jgi:amino acid transporter
LQRYTITRRRHRTDLPSLRPHGLRHNNQVTTASRQLYAFARDEGLPLSAFLGRVKPGWDIPLNVVTVTLLFSILVSFIILGSPVAFFTLGSLCNSALYASYLIVIGCVAWRRTFGDPLPPSRFDLGRAGMFVNVTAICFLSVQFVFIFFPTTPNPAPPLMNWTCAIFGGTVILALIWYYIHGTKAYLGPVEYVRISE